MHWPSFARDFIQSSLHHRSITSRLYCLHNLTPSTLASTVPVHISHLRHGFFRRRRPGAESHQAQSVRCCIFHCIAPNLPLLWVPPFLIDSANSGFAVLSAALSLSTMTVRLAHLRCCPQLPASLPAKQRISATDATFQASART